MAIRKSVTISLSPELLAVAERLLASGRFGNLSEVMRTALRQLEERELDFLAHRETRSALAAEDIAPTTLDGGQPIA